MIPVTTAPTLPPFVPQREPLPWATLLDGLLGRRCPARLHVGEVADVDSGRCGLRWHDPQQVAHALARGAFDVRWRAKVYVS